MVFIFLNTTYIDPDKNNRTSNGKASALFKRFSQQQSSLVGDIELSSNISNISAVDVSLDDYVSLDDSKDKV